MGLREVLQARAAFQGRTAEVVCGELGLVTVEALPLQEAEALARGADADRAVFYAACRELQAEGDAMHRAGRLYAPDGIMRLVSDEEAAAAAQVVLELSGVRRKAPSVGVEELPTETEGAVSESENAAEVTMDSEEATVDVRAAVPVPDREGEPLLTMTEAPREVEAEVPAVTVQKQAAEKTAEMPATEKAEEAVPQAEGALRREEVSAVSEPFFEHPAEEGAVDEESVPRLPQNTTAVSAAETVRIVRETESVETPAARRQEVFADRQQASAVACDAESVARQLLEGLRRAKWVRGA